MKYLLSLFAIMLFAGVSFAQIKASEPAPKPATTPVTVKERPNEVVVDSIPGSNAFAKAWNGIVPCVTTRLKAEKILGRDPDLFRIGIYKYKASRVHIHYELRRHTEIATLLHVYPDNPMLLAKYIRHWPNFSKEFHKREMDPRLSHIGYLAYYTNTAKGIAIGVQRNDDDVDVITSYTYQGLEAQCQK